MEKAGKPLPATVQRDSDETVGYRNRRDEMLLKSNLALAGDAYCTAPYPAE
jgi:hypothetical protein